MTYELADFAPDGHLHTCADQTECTCGERQCGCVGILYAVVARVEEKMAHWDMITSGESPTTARLREAMWDWEPVAGTQ
jgi:hypothetical protein